MLSKFSRFHRKQKAKLQSKEMIQIIENELSDEQRKLFHQKPELEPLVFEVASKMREKDSASKNNKVIRNLALYIICGYAFFCLLFVVTFAVYDFNDIDIVNIKLLQEGFFGIVNPILLSVVSFFFGSSVGGNS